MVVRRLPAAAPVAASLILGGFAVLLPVGYAQQESELAAFRGVAVGVVALLVGLAHALLWGASGPASLRDEVARLLRLLLATGAALVSALLTATSWTELDALSNLLQTSLGWREHLPVGPLGAFLLTVAFAASRLGRSLRREPLSGGVFLMLTGVGATLLLLTSGWRLGSIPAPVGLERLEKLGALALAATLLFAALVPGGRAARGYDRRALALGIGALVSASLGSEFARRYAHPRASDIREVVATRSSQAQSILTTTLRGRPDLYGLFLLPNASASVRLAYVRPLGTSPWVNVEEVTQVPWGFARLEPEEPRPPKEALRGHPSLDAQWLEVWFSVASPFRFELRSGIRVPGPILSWAVLPSGQAVVATTREQGRRREGSRFGASGYSDATYSVAIWRGFWGVLRPRTLLADLPLPPRTLEVSGRRIRLLVSGETYHRDQFRTASSLGGGEFVRTSQRIPAPPMVGTTDCDLGSMTCEPWRIVGGQLRAVAGRGSKLVVSRSEGWSLLDAGTLAPLYSVPHQERRDRPGSTRILPLSEGGLLRISLLGKMPDWDARVAAFDAQGRPLGELALGNVRLTRFAGELADGSLAIAWRTHYSYSLARSAVFGWVLEAWNPRTGKRRRLADDIATLPGLEDDPSLVFLDRRGRLVVPSADRLVEIHDDSGW